MIFNLNKNTIFLLCFTSPLIMYVFQQIKKEIEKILDIKLQQMEMELKKDMTKREIEIEQKLSQLKIELEKKWEIELQKKEKKKNDIKPTCPICLENLADNGQTYALKCSHCYHKKCIDRWFYEGRRVCPLCRDG